MNRQYATINYNDPQPYRTPAKNSNKYNNLDYNLLDDFEALDQKYSQSNKPNVRVEGYFGTANKGNGLSANLGEMMINKKESNLDVGNSRSNMIYQSAAPQSGYQSSEPFVSDLFGSTQALNKNNQFERQESLQVDKIRQMNVDRLRKIEDIKSSFINNDMD